MSYLLPCSFQCLSNLSSASTLYVKRDDDIIPIIQRIIKIWCLPSDIKLCLYFHVLVYYSFAYWLFNWCSMFSWLSIYHLNNWTSSKVTFHLTCYNGFNTSYDPDILKREVLEYTTALFHKDSRWKRSKTERLNISTC